MKKCRLIIQHGMQKSNTIFIYFTYHRRRKRTFQFELEDYLIPITPIHSIKNTIQIQIYKLLNFVIHKNWIPQILLEYFVEFENSPCEMSKNNTNSWCEAIRKMQVAPSSPLVEILKFNKWFRRWTDLGVTPSFSGSSRSISGVYLLKEIETMDIQHRCVCNQSETYFSMSCV